MTTWLSASGAICT